MSEKEYIFVGNAQLKTRDYIKQLEKDNRGKDKEIERLNKRLKEIDNLVEEVSDSYLEDEDMFKDFYEKYYELMENKE